MRVELDSCTYTVTDEDIGQVVFACNCYLQYQGLMEKLLSPSQLDKHIYLMHDGIYTISSKRLLSGEEYMKNNPFNKRN